MAGSSSRLAPLAFVALLGLLALAACTEDEASAADLCEALDAEPPESRWDDADLIVFVDPAASDRDVEALQGAVESDEEVADHTWVSQGDAYDEFVELWAESPEMIDAVSPEILPASIRIEARSNSPEEVDAIARRYQGRPGVFRVVQASEVRLSILAWNVTPLAEPEMLHFAMFHRAAGVDLGLADAAPPELRDAARAVDEHWQDHGSPGTEIPAAVVEAAAELMEFHDSECG